MRLFVAGQIAVSADAVSAFAFGAVKRRISHFDEFNRVARIVGKRRDADADGNAMFFVEFAVPDDAEHLIFDFRANSFRRDQALSEFGVEQKRGELFAAETRRRVAAAQILRDAAPISSSVLLPVRCP
jgi:hypothetical protein